MLNTLIHFKELQYYINLSPVEKTLSPVMVANLRAILDDHWLSSESERNPDAAL